MVLDIEVCQNHLQTTNQTSYPGWVTILNSLQFFNYMEESDQELIIAL
jgi:hypothetical protein